MVPALYAHDPFLAIQTLLRSPWLDGPMAIASVSCEGWAIALIAVAFVLPRERGARAAARVLLPLAAGLLLAGLGAQVVKALVSLPRPLTVYGAERVHVLLEPLRMRSFPSGHAASAAALATFTAVRYGRAAWPLVLLAAVGGLSRVYVGAHWATDVLAGWALGAACAVAGAAAWARLARHLPRAGRSTAASPSPSTADQQG